MAGGFILEGRKPGAHPGLGHLGSARAILDYLESRPGGATYGEIERALGYRNLGAALGRLEEMGEVFRRGGAYHSTAAALSRKGGRD